MGLSPAGVELGARQETTVARGGALRTLLWLVGNFEEVVTASLLGIMIGSVGLSVIFRYALQRPLTWTEEIVLVCMVWTTFLGACVVTKHQEHIVIDVVISLMPKWLSRPMRILVQALVTAFLVLLLWQGIVLVQMVVDRSMTTTTLGIPVVFMYAAVPVSAVLMIIHDLRQMYASLRRRWGG